MTTFNCPACSAALVLTVAPFSPETDPAVPEFSGGVPAPALAPPFVPSAAAAAAPAGGVDALLRLHGVPPVSEPAPAGGQPSRRFSVPPADGAETPAEKRLRGLCLLLEEWLAAGGAWHGFRPSIDILHEFLSWWEAQGGDRSVESWLTKNLVSKALGQIGGEFVKRKEGRVYSVPARLAPTGEPASDAEFVEREIAPAPLPDPLPAGIVLPAPALEPAFVDWSAVLSDENASLFLAGDTGPALAWFEASLPDEATIVSPVRLLSPNVDEDRTTWTAAARVQLPAVEPAAYLEDNRVVTGPAAAELAELVAELPEPASLGEVGITPAGREVVEAMRRGEDVGHLFDGPDVDEAPSGSHGAVYGPVQKTGGGREAALARHKAALEDQAAVEKFAAELESGLVVLVSEAAPLSAPGAMPEWRLVVRAPGGFPPALLCDEVFDRELQAGVPGARRLGSVAIREAVALTYDDAYTLTAGFTERPLEPKPRHLEAAPAWQPIAPASSTAVDVPVDPAAVLDAVAEDEASIEEEPLPRGMLAFMGLPEPGVNVPAFTRFDVLKAGRIARSAPGAPQQWRVLVAVSAGSLDLDLAGRVFDDSLPPGARRVGGVSVDETVIGSGEWALVGAFTDRPEESGPAAGEDAPYSEDDRALDEAAAVERAAFLEERAALPGATHEAGCSPEVHVAGVDACTRPVPAQELAPGRWPGSRAAEAATEHVVRAGDPSIDEALHADAVADALAAQGRAQVPGGPADVLARRRAAAAALAPAEPAPLFSYDAVLDESDWGE